MLNEKNIIYGENFNYQIKEQNIIMFLNERDFANMTKKENSVKILTMSKKWSNSYYQVVNEHLTITYDPCINK